MRVNGLIIQRKTEGFYKGVEGDNWYLNYCGHKELDEFFKENIEKAWENNDYVDVCNSVEFIKTYIDISVYEEISYRLIACATEKEFPQMKLDKQMKFLGYDYAYSGGSYYSAILNDIISKRIPQFADIQLNKNGLFDTYEGICDFINTRKSLKDFEKKSSEYIEEGDFIIYQLYETSI